MNTGNVKKTYWGGMLTLLMLFAMIMLCCLTDNSVYAMTGVSSGDLYADKSSVTMNVAEHSYITVIDTSNRFNGSNGELAVSSTNSSIVYIKSKDFSNSSYSDDLKQSYNNMYLIKIQALAEGEASIRIRNSYGNMLTVPVKVDKMKRTAVFGDSETLKFTYKDEMWSPSPNMLTFDIGGMISYEVDYTDEALMAKLSSDTFDLHINDIEFSAPDGLSFSEDSSTKTYYIVPQSDIVVNLNDKFTVSVPVFAESDYAAEKYASTAAITVTAHTDAGTFSHSYGVNIFDDRKRGSVNPDPDAYSGKCIVVTASSINSTKDLVVSEGEDVVVKGDVSCNNLYVNGGTLTICSKSTLNVIGSAIVSGGSTNWLNPISTDKCGGVLEVNGKLKVGNDLTVSEPCGILNMRNSGCSVTVMNNFLITTNSTTYTCTLTEGTLSVGGKFEASGKYSGNFKASQNHLTVLSGNSFDVVMDKSDSHFNHLALSDEAYSSFTSSTEKELYSANIKGRFYKLSDKNSDLTKYLSDNNPVLRQLDETYNNYMGKSDFKDNMSSLKKYVSSEFFDKIVADTMFFCDMENMAIATNSSESGLNFAQWFTDISFVAYFNNGNTVLEMNAPNEPTVYVCVAWLGQSIGSKKSTVSASLFNVRYIVDCGNDKYITGDRVCTLSFKDLDNLGNSLVEIYKDTTNTNGTIDDYLTWFKKYVLASYSDMNTIFNAATGTNGKLDLTDINVLTNLTQKTYKAVKNKNLGSFAIKSPADVSKLPKKITTFLSSDKSAWDIATLISCPVNVVVKDSTGAVVAYVSDNQVKVTSDEADISVINGDQKYIRFGSIDDYTLELTGTDSGTMSYYVYECDSDEINRTFCADNIPLTDGIKYTGKVDSITDCSADDFSLTDDDGEKYKPSSDGSASEPETDYTQFSYTISNGEVEITGCRLGHDTVIKIPSKIKGYPVTSIGYKAFSDCTILTSITIPDSVTSIGRFAFCFCTNLETITIPKNVKFDSNGCTFDYCTSLKNVKFSSGIEKIPDYLFYGGRFLNSLKSITIPDSVTSVGYRAFSNCRNLETITIPKNAKFDSAGSTFDNCTSLKNVIFSNGIEKIPDYLFDGSSNLDSLTSITIPNSVTTIGDSAFSGCTGLTSIAIPDSVTSIGYQAFSYCKGLTSITIPDSVTSIGYYAFDGCTNLTICCYPNSYAEKYAKSTNIPYKYLEEKPKISITPVISVSTVQVSENAAESDVIAAIRAAATVSFGNTNVDSSDYELVITAVSGKKDTYTVSVKLTRSGSGKYTLTSDGAKEITVTRKSSEEASKPVITAANAYDCSVDLEWTAVSGAEKYAVYYTVGGKWYNAGTTTELSMTVTGLTGAIKYGFAVKAYVNNAWTGIASADIVYAIPTSMMDKAGITSIQLIENGTLRIGWSPISGAEKYAFYYIVDGKWHTIGTTTERNIVVTNLKDNVKYGFAIKGCINGLWTEIRNSDIIYYTPDFSKPYIIKAEPQDGKVALNWISVDGATQYAVYYTVGGKWYNAGTTTALGKYVTGLTGGTKYGFAVKAYVNGAWTGIISSNIVYATPTGEAAKPKITKAQGQDGKVALNWTAVDGATNYAVYSYLNGKWSVAGYRTATGMYVTGLTNGTKYGFAVKAYVNGAWTGITSSDIVYATPVGSAAVKPVITKAQGQDGRVALNWTTVDGATNYAVYTYLNGKWSVAGYRTATGMYVTGLTNGTRYGFAVKAYVNGAWTSITSSDIVYAAPTAAKSEIMFDDFLDFIDVAPVSR